METILIDILNPEAKKLLKELMKQKLIRMSKVVGSVAQVTTFTVSEPMAPYEGKKLRAILDKLAKENGLSSLDDPSEWQREQREDRKLD